MYESQFFLSIQNEGTYLLIEKKRNLSPGQLALFFQCYAFCPTAMNDLKRKKKQRGREKKDNRKEHISVMLL